MNKQILIGIAVTVAAMAIYDKVVKPALAL